MSKKKLRNQKQKTKSKKLYIQTIIEELNWKQINFNKKKRD
jgi:hypothetical protein